MTSCSFVAVQGYIDLEAEILQLVEDQGAWVRVEKSDGLAGWAERENLELTTERQRRLEHPAREVAAVVRRTPPAARAPGGIFPERFARKGHRSFR